MDFKPNMSQTRLFIFPSFRISVPSLSAPKIKPQLISPSTSHIQSDSESLISYMFIKPIPSSLDLGLCLVLAQGTGKCGRLSLQRWSPSRPPARRPACGSRRQEVALSALPESGLPESCSDRHSAHDAMWLPRPGFWRPRSFQFSALRSPLSSPAAMLSGSPS